MCLGCQMVIGSLLLSEGNTVRIVNSAVYAMQVLQQEMAGEAERAGLTSEDTVVALVKEARKKQVQHLQRGEKQ